MMPGYEPEAYWSKVAQEIEKRGESYVAGDDNPYYKYKRRKFLKNFLDTIDFESKDALEIGFGPGGNLKHIVTHHSPRKLYGVDISQSMFEIATKHLRQYDNVELAKGDGSSIPYPDRLVDISFTVTVLQHNTDEKVLRVLVPEICRVTKSTIIIMEDVGQCATVGAEGSWVARQIGVYKDLFAEQGFQLAQCEFLNTKISRIWCQRATALHNRLRSVRHGEGEPIGLGLKLAIGLPMPATRLLDLIFVEEQNLAKMVFQRV